MDNWNTSFFIQYIFARHDPYPEHAIGYLGRLKAMSRKLSRALGANYPAFTRIDVT